MMRSRVLAAGGLTTPWAVALILLVPVLVRLPFWLAGLRESPLWTTSSLMLPNRAAPLPGLPGYLDLNAGWTTQALGGSAARQWLQGQIPWWDPFTGIGMPLAAEMQSSALFLPYILLLALPAGYVLLLLSLQWTAGLATWRLLLRLRLGQEAAVVGAVLFELCASFAWLGPPAGLPVAFLPLFLLGIERAHAAVLAGQPGGWRVIAAAVALSLYAGFPETAYLNGLLALLWAAAGMLTAPGLRVRFMIRVGGGGMVGLLLAAPLLWPFFDLLQIASLGAREGTDMSVLSVPPSGVVQLLTPYALGLPAGLSGLGPSDTLVWLWGRAGGYAGMVLALAAVLGAFVPGPNRRLRWLLLAWTAVLLTKITGVPYLSDLFRLVPFHDQLQIFRYSGAAWLLPCCILAAHAVEQPVPRRPSWAAAGGLAVVAGAAAWVAWPLARDIPTAPDYMAASLAWGMASLLLGGAAFASGRRRMVAVVLAADAAVLFMVPLLSGQHNPRLDWPAIAFLRSNLGLQRFATLGPFQPNYGAFFGLASVNHNYLPSPVLWSDHVTTVLRPGGDPVLFTGNYPPDAPDHPTNAAILRQRLSAYSDLGVRYVLAPADSNPFGDAPEPGIPPGPKQALTLDLSTSLSGRLDAPARAIRSVAITVGTFEGQSTGLLQLEICGATGCVQGQAPLATAADNRPLDIPLQRPFMPDGPVTWTLRHGGGHPVAIWRWPGNDGLAPRIVLHLDPAPGKPARVYADAIMTIFELADPAPYMSAHGGSCVLAVQSRTVVETRCNAPATLVRRELMLPGWRARVGGLDTEPGRDGALFQSVPLPAGSARVEFRYTPPGAPAFTALFALGVLALLPWSRLPRMGRSVTQRSRSASTGSSTP